jgi:hypothetical protein
VGEKVEGSSLWASRGRPRSWITCAIRRNQTQSGGNHYGRRWMTCAIRCNQTQSIGKQEAIRGAIRGLQRPSEGPSEAIRGQSEATQRRSPPCPRDCHLARERRPDLWGEAPW